MSDKSDKEDKPKKKKGKGLLMKAVIGLVLVAAGGHPVLMAAILPAITGAMEGMTPPLALCMYTAMGIAQSPFKQTAKTAILWISLHYIMSVLVILGILPILGL